MDTPDYKREDQPRQINPNEIGKSEPAKKIKAQEKIDIKESELGREQGQTPADEHIESQLPQIDAETVKLRESPESSDEINDTDDRDLNDSTTDWDAENSRTGRHK